MIVTIAKLKWSSPANGDEYLLLNKVSNKKLLRKQSKRMKSLFQSKDLTGMKARKNQLNPLFNL